MSSSKPACSSPSKPPAALSTSAPPVSPFQVRWCSLIAAAPPAPAAAPAPPTRRIPTRPTTAPKAAKCNRELSQASFRQFFGQGGRWLHNQRKKDSEVDLAYIKGNTTILVLLKTDH